MPAAGVLRLHGRLGRRRERSELRNRSDQHVLVRVQGAVQPAHQDVPVHVPVKLRGLPKGVGDRVQRDARHHLETVAWVKWQPPYVRVGTGSGRVSTPPPPVS